MIIQTHQQRERELDKDIIGRCFYYIRHIILCAST
jgi:hypothetical protein